ncbi:MAG TPA: endonuclease/exonuclease/phosphatase family protein [Acidimicrobiia bacterium]|nr:endonuclease/exonuclease/phosphatase family protein [Acidimicrobiia bacterium]
MIRVVSTNLYNHNVDLESLARLIEEERPDFLAAQELTPAAGRVIAGRLPHGLLQPRDGTDGIGIASASPVRVRRHPLPHRDAMVADGPFSLWSVHLANPVDAPPPWRARRAQVHALAAAVTGLRPVLVVGDFNATPWWPAYRILTRVLDDGVATLAERRGERPKRTWSYRALTPTLLRIDHALIGGLRLADARTRVVAGSDHRALVVDVETDLSPGDPRSS